MNGLKNLKRNNMIHLFTIIVFIFAFIGFIETMSKIVDWIANKFNK